MKNLKWLLPVSVLLLASCSSSKITSTFKTANSEEHLFSRILVLGLMQDKDISLQEKMENHLSGDLKEMGYTVITSLEEYGPRAFKDLTEEQAIGKLENSKVEVVVTITLLNKKMEKQFVPAQPQYPQPLFWDYYGTINRRVLEPGYYVDITEYIWESNVYDLKSQSLLYSVRTTSFNPNTTESLAHGYGKMIVRSMRRNNIIHRDPEPVKKGF